MARRVLTAMLIAGCAAVGVVGCSHDYDALMGTSSGVGGLGGSAGSDAGPGAGGTFAGGGTTGAGGQPAGTAGTFGGDTGGYGGGGAAGTTSGRGGSGGGGAAGTTNRGGSGGGGAAGTTNRGGSGGGGAAGTTSRGGSGGGGAAGTANRGGSGGGGAAGTTSRGGSGGGGAAGASRGGSGGGAGAGNNDGEPVLWYKFDDATGNIAADSSTAPGAPRNGTLTAGGTGGAIAFSTEHQVGTHAINLISSGTAGGGYVVGPSLHNVAPGAMTISVWVNVTTAQFWQRVFDFGNTTTLNFALTTHNGSNNPRFVIRTAGATDEQAINTTTTLSLSTWHHLAVVLREGAPYTGELYVNGTLAGSNTAMTLHAADLGPTANNFIGKSQFADPYFAGLIDDFRVYRRALSAEQINRLASPRQPTDP